MRWRLIFCVLALSGPVAAQETPTDEHLRFLITVNEAFLDALVDMEPEQQRAFFTPSFHSLTTSEGWSDARATLAEHLGHQPRYKVHRLTWYPRDKLVAAVDFSGSSDDGERHVCGAALWEFDGPATIGLMRLEESVVEPEIFREMPVEDAARQLSEWYCPPALIRSILGLSNP